MDNRHSFEQIIKEEKKTAPSDLPSADNFPKKATVATIQKKPSIKPSITSIHQFTKPAKEEIKENAAETTPIINSKPAEAFSENH